MTYLLDLTSARAHSERAVLARFMETVPMSEDVVVLARLSQDASTISDVTVERVLDEDFTSDVRFAARVQAVAGHARKTGSTVTVYSFSPRTRSLVEEESSRDQNILFAPLAPLTTQAHAESSWDSDFMNPEDAVDHLVAVLAERGELDTTKLRTPLEIRDKRFSKTDGPSYARRIGFIGKLTSLALASGLVRVASAGKIPTSPLLALTDDGRTRAAKLQPSQDRVTGLSEERVSAVISAETTDASTSTIHVDDKAQQWLILLREHDFGPYQQVRHAIYDELAVAAASNPSQLDAVKLVKRAVGNVRQRYQTPDGRKGLPWERVTDFMIRLLRRERVLLSAGSPVDVLYGEKRPVDGIADQFRVQLDGRVVLQLLELGASVHSMNDDGFLGVVLTDQPVEGRTWAEEVIEYLERENQILVDPSFGDIVLASPAALETVPGTGANGADSRTGRQQ